MPVDIVRNAVMRSLAARRLTLAVLALLAPTCALAQGVPTVSATPTHYAVAQRANLSGDVSWDYLSFDAASSRLFIARSDRVQVVDPATGRELGNISGQQGVHGIALASDLHLGFASNEHSNSVTVFDLASLKIVAETKVTGVGPDAILYVREAHRVYAFNGQSNDVTVIDAATFEVVDTILLDGRPDFAATDGRMIYVNLQDRARLATIDLATDQVVHQADLAPCEEPTGLAIDALRHRLFSVCKNGKMMVVDAPSGRIVAELAIGKQPDAVAYDPIAELVFSSSAGGTLSVWRQDDADHYSAAQTVPTKKSARTLALNPLNHSIYLVGADFQPAAGVSGDPRARPAMVSGSFMLLTVSVP